jgi:hypothetical protein
VAAALLAWMAAAMSSTARLETATWDEPTHLTLGYLYWRTGNLWWNQENPALPRLLAALPLVAAGPRLPVEHESYRRYDTAGLRREFLFHNHVPADTLLWLARLPMIGLALVFGLVLALWTRRHFGESAALGALALFALDPNFTAHGRYAATDVPTAACYFFSTIAWARYLRTRRWRDLLLAGLLLGLALATKHSLVLLIPVFLALWLIYWRQHPEERPGRAGAGLAAAAAIAVAVVAAVYWPASADVFLKGQWSPMAAQIDASRPDGRFFHRLAETLRLPYHPYLMGFYWVAITNTTGPPNAYLLGDNVHRSWWYFYPVVFAVKSPLALLAGLAAALGFTLATWRRRLRGIEFRWWVLGVPAAAWFAMILWSHWCVGIRHMLPVYPFLFAGVAAVLARRRRILVLVMAAVLLSENAMIYPHYTAFFNGLAGGPARGPEYLVDSNLDWGQDLKKAKAWLDSRGAPNVCISYFGTAEPAYYGLTGRPLNPVPAAEEREALDCVAMISATHLRGVMVPPESFAWLRKREPDARVGYSIYMYDLRKNAR